MSSLLGIDAIHVGGCCMRLWSWADVESNGGWVARGTVAMIDALVRIKGFADAMNGVGWLTIEADGVRFPHWDRHNGASAKERVMDQAKHWRNRHPKSGHDRDMIGTKSGQHRNKTTQTTQTTQHNTDNTKDKGGGLGGKPKADLFALDGLPPDFHTDEFKAAWSAWVENRRDTRHPLTPRAVTIAKNKLAAWGPTKAIQALNDATIGGWQGLFEPKENQGGNHRESDADRRRRDQRAKEFPEPDRPLPRL